MRVVATAGHVDHGKSALVRALTGTDPDRFAEEQARGLTIDLGFAFTTLDDGEVIGFVDVPGHVRFAKNMLAGVGSVDLAMLVVDAREGWMPQTAEHVQILGLLGVEHGCIALTKADLVDAETLELATLELEDHLSTTQLASWPLTVCDALSGRGIDALRATLTEVCRSAPPPRDLHCARLWVDRSFSVRGAGTVVTGTLTLGALSIDDEVRIEPGGRTARVRGIESHHSSATTIGPGTRVALNLAGIDHRTIDRGDAVVAPGRWRTTDHVDAVVTAVPGTRLPARATLHAHIGAGVWPTRWRSFEAETSGDALGRLRFDAALPLQPGDHLVLRSTARSAIVGGAIVVDVAPSRRTVDALARRALTPVQRAVAARPFIDGHEIALLAALDRADPAGAIEREIAAGRIMRVGASYAAPATVDALLADVAQRVATHEHTYPDDPGLELTALAARVHADPAHIRDAIASHPAGALDIAAGRVRSRATAPAMPTSATPDGARLLEALRAQPFAPPSATELGIAPRVAKLLVREGVAVELDGVVFATDAVEAAARIVGTAVVQRGTLTIADVRDLLGSTRKYVVPIAKRLDADGVTRRRGDDRIPGPRAARP